MNQDLFSCKNRTAIVTGGCGLIGKEIVKGLSEYGADVYIADQNEEVAQKLLNQNINYIDLDITSESSVQRALNRIILETGRVDILVNSAYPRTKGTGVQNLKM